MKTLNEVIKAWSICFSDISRSDCTECPYADDDGEAACFNHDREDALHYLKEYRAEMKHAEDICLKAEKVVKDAERNDPISWDELKQMEGKPVWVETLLYKQWAVIAYVGDDHIRFEGVNLYAPESRIYMGEENGWQAYRKERQ